MVFCHVQIRDDYLMSYYLLRGGLSGCLMICRVEVYPDVRPLLLLVIVTWQFLGLDMFGCISWIYFQHIQIFKGCTHNLTNTYIKQITKKAYHIQSKLRPRLSQAREPSFNTMHYPKKWPTEEQAKPNNIH